MSTTSLKLPEALKNRVLIAAFINEAMEARNDMLLSGTGTRRVTFCLS